MNDTKLCEIISKELRNADTILDVGCGEGFLVNCLAKELNRKIVGLDVSIAGFTKAHNRCKKFEVCDLVECIRGDAHNMELFKDGEFGAITLIYALHHTSNPEIVLKEVKRILKPDGRIIMVEYIVRKRKSKCHKFMKEEVNKMLETAGFRDIIIQKLEEDLILSSSRK